MNFHTKPHQNLHLLKKVTIIAVTKTQNSMKQYLFTPPN